MYPLRVDLKTVGSVFKNEEISLPTIFHYFEAIYKKRAMCFMNAPALWWPDFTSSISDSEFDRIIDDVLIADDL